MIAIGLLLRVGREERLGEGRQGRFGEVQVRGHWMLSSVKVGTDSRTPQPASALF
jgi:hypothetical protein